MAKQIKDPVHGYIEVPDELIPFLDLPVLQRLHYIRQLGFAYLVYPGANHTRFEHSLGAMSLADKVCQNVGLEEDERLMVCCAALLHDIGHGPYSHASERLRSEFGAFSHDDILPFADILDPLLGDIGCDIHEAAAIISGNHRLAPIIHGDLDVDRMDYLLRDAHYSGVPYGTLDANRLIQSLFMDDEHGLTLRDSGVAAAESLLIARTLMGPSVYYHHVSRIAEEMFLLAGRLHFTGDTIDAFMRMDDAEGTMTLLNSPNAAARDLMMRIRSRRLFKRAVYVGRDQVDMPRLTQLSSASRERLRMEISDAAGVDEHAVILDIPPLRKDMQMQVKVKSLHDYVPFEDIVPLLPLMNATRQEQWRLGVYAAEENVEAVKRAALDVLGVSSPTKQVRLEF
ncbi:MAG: HD domain-containing protein [Methanocorpusculum parvum]|nr:HD domain-containing protein [Methanocorpusculum parvum]